MTGKNLDSFVWEAVGFKTEEAFGAGEKKLFVVRPYSAAFHSFPYSQKTWFLIQDLTTEGFGKAEMGLEYVQVGLGREFVRAIWTGGGIWFR